MINKIYSVFVFFFFLYCTDKVGEETIQVFTIIYLCFSIAVFDQQKYYYRFIRMVFAFLTFDRLQLAIKEKKSHNFR